MTRSKLPNRRASQTLKVEYADMSGFRLKAHVTYSRDAAGQMAEVFIVAATPGSSAEAAYRDAGIVLSLALQHGATVQEVAGAMTRTEDDAPAGPLGVVLDALVREDEAFRNGPGE